MKKSFLYLAAALLAVCSCVDEKEGPDAGQNGGGTSTETPEELPELAEGEVAYKAIGEFFLENKEEQTDGVMLAFEDGCEAAMLWVESLEVQTGTAVVKSTGNAAYFVASASKDKTYHVVYPSAALAGAVMADTGMEMNVIIPQVQDGTLAGANICVAKAAKDAESLNFRNICGLLKFSVYSSEVQSVTFRGMKGEQLVGTLPVVRFDLETGNPVTGTPIQTSEEVKVVINGKPGTYYAAVLPGLVMEGGFTVSFEMMAGAQITLENAKSDYEIATKRSSYTVLGQIEDYIPQQDWFVTPEGTETADGKSWETAISAEQMFQMLAFNRAMESGVGNSSTDVASDAYRETCSAYLRIHSTRHALQLDGTIFHLAEGDYSTTNYVRVSFPDQGRQVSISIKGGYNPGSGERDPENHVTRLKKPYGSGTARMLFLQKWLDMSFDGLTFYGGTGDGTVGGGAVLLNESESSTFVFRNCRFDSNSSNSYGGAIVGSNSVGKLTFEDCVFTGNISAKDGGAIRMTSGMWAFSDCEFTDNQSKANAGAICCGADVFSATDVVFSGNSCAPDAGNNGQGGAIYFATNENATAERTLTRCTFIGNTVSAADAVYNDDVKRYVRGGAIYVAGVPKVAISGCTFTANEQKDYTSYKTFGGGAIYSVSEISISGTTFSGNKAYYGGAFGFTGTVTCTDGTFAGNTAVNGGALYGISSATASFTGCSFNENEVSGNGGAAWLNPVNATFANCDFVENNITANNVGGAIYLSGTSALTLSGGTFDSNHAGKSGGAIYNSGPSTINITDMEFIRNDAGTTDGGAIWNSGAASIAINGNTSFTGNVAASYGGAIRSNHADAVFKIDAVSFSGNTSKYGACFYLSAGTAYMNNSVMTANKPTNKYTGGTMYLIGGTMFINNSSFHDNDNTGSLHSTDLVVNGSPLVVMNTSFIENKTNMSAVLAYNQTETAALQLYNNIILAGEYNVCAGYYANPGAVTSCGYNYTGAWSTKVDAGVTASATTVSTDNVVTPADVFDNFTKTATTDGRNYYTWPAPQGIGMTTVADMTTFLNGVTGGADFATWLGTVNGLSHDIAGNPRPATGAVYPGCYQK